MTALTNDKTRRTEAWSKKTFVLKSGSVAFRHGVAALELATGKVVPISSVPGLLRLGVFIDPVDATAADKNCSVHFDRELVIEYFVNGTGGDEITAADVGRIAYAVDDQTVGRLSTGGRAPAGRIWNVDTALGVAIEPVTTHVSGGVVVAAAPAFAAGDSAPSATLVEAADVLTIPTTAANSTVSLPAGVREGTTVTFVADGTANGHTVQYQDATGPVALTAALTASKRHEARCVFAGGVWVAVAGAAP